MRILALVLLLALAPTAGAGEWYVNGATGSDANGGTSPADAWRTLTHATQQFPQIGSPSLETIHVAPGHYGVPDETFPIQLRKDVRLVGEGGAAATHLVGDGDTIVTYHTSFAFGFTAPSVQTGLSGFTLSLIHI